MDEITRFSCPDCKEPIEVPYAVLADGNFRCPWCQLLIGVANIIDEPPQDSGWENKRDSFECPECGRTVTASFAELAGGNVRCDCGVRIRVGNIEEVLAHAKDLESGRHHVVIDNAVSSDPTRSKTVFPAVFERLRMEMDGKD
jgi:hypothetical protein